MLERRVLLASDLWIERLAATGAAESPFASIEVTFSAAVDAGTFDVSDVVVSGAGSPGVAAITLIDDTRFRIDTTGTTGAVTSLTIGPAIASVTGDALDTNRNGTGGEAGDAYRATLADVGITIGVDDGAFDNTNLLLARGSSTIGGTHSYASLQSVGGSLSLPGGVVTLLDASRIGGDLTITGGVLSIGATLALAGTTSWSGGTISGGTLTNTGFMQIVGPDSQVLLSQATLSNFGTLAFVGANRLRLVNFDGPPAALLRNEPSGLIDFRVDDGQFGPSLQGDGTNRLLNLGTIRKSGGSTTTTITAPVDNQGGTIDVQVGAIVLGGQGATASTGGTFTVATGATLYLTNPGGNGTNTSLAGTYTASGGGKVVLAAGTLAIGAAGATFAFPAGMFEWSGGTISGGTLTNTGFMQIVGPDSQVLLSQATLSNFGTLAFVGANRLRLVNFDGPPAALLRNEPSGLIDFRVDDGQLGPSLQGDGTNRLLNLGTIRKSGGSTTTTTIDVGHFDNVDGTVEVASGVVRFSYATQPGGRWIVAGIAQETVLEGYPLASVQMPGGGQATANDLDLTLVGPLARVVGLDGIGFNRGTIRLRDAAGFVGNSSVSILDNSGSLDIGPGSTFAVGDDFRQTAGGVTRIAIGGAPDSGLVGRLRMPAGVAMLDGRLDVQLVNGFGPSLGQTYTLVEVGENPLVDQIDGSFNSITGLQNGRFALFTAAQDTRTVTVSAAVTSADLAVTSVVSGGGEAAPGDVVAIDYAVGNVGTSPAVGGWFDTFFLSGDAVLDPGDVQIGRVEHQGTLAAGESYTGRLTATLPAVAGLRRVIMTSDSTGLVPDLNRVNNVAFTTTPIAITAPQLPLGSSAARTLAADGSSYWAVTVPAGTDVRVDVTGGGGRAVAFARFGDLPSPAAFDLQSVAGVGDRQLVLPGSRPGTWYVAVKAPSNAPAAFQIAAAVVPFEVTASSPARGSNLGSATIAVSGLGFTPAATVALRRGAADRMATNVRWVSSTQLLASFDLTGLEVGDYAIVVNDAAREDRIDSGFSVTAGQPGKLEAHITGPQIARPGRVLTLTVDYANTGETELPAQVLVINGGRNIPVPPSTERYEPALFRLPGQTEWSTGGIMVLATPAEGAIGTIPAGFRGSFTVQMSTGLPLVAHEFVDYAVSTVDPAEAIDWGSLKASLRPATMPADAWDAIFANFITRAGGSWGDLERLLAADAALLAGRGQATRSVAELVAFELAEAGNMGVIENRYRLGSLGRGIAGPTDFDLTFLANGATNTATLRTPAGERTFSATKNGQYAEEGGYATLTTAAVGSSGIEAVIREKTGETITFRSESAGLHGERTYGLTSIADRLGNRITPTSTDGRITSFTDAFGDTVAYAYGANGRIVRSTDAVGRVTTYAYDAAGEHLLSITDATGTISFTWVTGQGAQREHAIESVAYPDGTHDFFTYDARGRLVTSSRDGGASLVTYSYPEIGKAVATDALGRTFSASLDQFGRPVRDVDTFGQSASASYDANSNLTSLVTPVAAVHLGYDAAGNLVSQTDPLGTTLRTAYDPRLNLPTSFADGLGRVIRYEYDAIGNHTATVYADGSADRYGYDPVGNVVSWTNRAGGTTRYVYDAKNLLTSRILVDGATTSFTYDARRNLTAIADASGTTGFNYDAADRLTGVTYPGGRSLAYGYDAAGRRTTLTDDAGNVTRYAYDAAGRLSRVSDTRDATIAAYTYDAAGAIVRRDLGNGGYVTYVYAASGALGALANHASDGTIISSYAYGYDLQGRVTSVVTAAGTTTYQYDAASQLTGVTLPGGRTIAYVYDAAGNRTSVTDGGTTTLYVSNALNQYTQVGDTTYTYDTRGFLTSATNPTGTTSCAYDARGRLATAIGPTGRWDYAYDVLGHVVGVTHDGVRTDYVWDPTGIGSLVGAYSAAGSTRYTYGLGLEGSTNATGVGSTFYTFDGTGNTSAVVDAAGTVLNAYSWLPFGEKLSSSGTAANPFTFVAQAGVADFGGDLYSMRARWYAPTTGRFTQPDPIGLDGGDLNLYRYVRNAAPIFADPSGLEPEYTGTQRNAIEAFEGSGAGNAGIVRANYGEGRREIVRQSEQFISDTGKQLLTLPYAVATAESGPLGYLGDQTKDYGKSVARDFIKDKIKDQLYINHPPTQDVLTAYTNDKLKDVLADLRRLYGNYSDDALMDLLREERKLRNQSISSTEGRTSDDPNDIVGPGGFGAGGFLTAALTLPYTIRFENKATASAPAQEVFISQQLDADLDFSTFEWGAFKYGDRTVEVAPGLKSVRMQVDDTATTGLIVDVAGDLDTATGALTWTFRSLDPATLDLPADPLAGFLPPNTRPPIGDGSISYVVRARAGAATGTRIDARADIIFDTNPVIPTPPIYNTIDVAGPTSSVTVPAATTSNTSFTVNWSGSDDAAGSGIASYEVYVSDDGGVYTLWQSATTATTGTFAGRREHTYRFYSVATDNVGIRQAIPAVAQAQVTVTHATPTDISLSNAGVLENAPSGAGIGTLSTTDSEAGKTYTYTLVSGAGSTDNASFQIDGDTLKTAAVFNFETAGSHSVRIRSTDTFGLFTEKQFTISVTNVNEAPTDIVLSAATTPENNAIGAAIGTLSTTDPDSGDTFTYTLVSGAGSTDNALFQIDGNTLKAAASFNFEAKSSSSIRVRSTDAGGHAIEQVLTIEITDVVDEPLLVERVAPMAPGAYRAGQRVRFELLLSEAVQVRGKPQIQLRLDRATRAASYLSGSGSPVLTFEYVVAKTDNAAIVSLGQKFVLPRNSAITAGREALAVALPAGIAGAPATGVRFDAVAPRTSGRVRTPAGGTYGAGQALDFVVRFSEAVLVGGTPQMGLTGLVGSRQAQYIAGSGTTELTFRYVVQTGDAMRGRGGLGLARTLSLPRGASITDVAGNRAVLTISSPTLKGVRVGATAAGAVTNANSLGDVSPALRRPVGIAAFAKLA